MQDVRESDVCEQGCVSKSVGEQGLGIGSGEMTRPAWYASKSSARGIRHHRFWSGWVDYQAADLQLAYIHIVSVRNF